MNLEKKLDTIKFLFVFGLLPMYVVLFVKTGTVMFLSAIILALCFTSFWLWQWERRLKTRTDFWNLASRIPHLAGEEREKAYAKLFDLVRANPALSNNIAQVFDAAAAADERRASREAPEDND